MGPKEQVGRGEAVERRGRGPPGRRQNRGQRVEGTRPRAGRGLAGRGLEDGQAVAESAGPPKGLSSGWRSARIPSQEAFVPRQGGDFGRNLSASALFQHCAHGHW